MQLRVIYINMGIDTLMRWRKSRRRWLAAVGDKPIPELWPRHESFRDKSIKNKTLFYWCQRKAIRIVERSHLTIYYNRRVMFVVKTIFLYFCFINIVMIVL